MIVDAPTNRPETAEELPIASLAMGYPSYPPPRPPKRPVATADLLISIGTLVLTVALGVVAGAMGLFSLAFLDHCPPETCSVEGAVNAVGTALIVAFGVGVVGLALTIVALVRRKPGWPFAVGTFVLCAVAIFLGGVGYASAVG
jgi:uncharacterized BrkB/YihY/UPF0761 family membrane protein